MNSSIFLFQGPPIRTKTAALSALFPPSTSARDCLKAPAGPSSLFGSMTDAEVHERLPMLSIKTIAYLRESFEEERAEFEHLFVGNLPVPEGVEIMTLEKLLERDRLAQAKMNDGPAPELGPASTVIRPDHAEADAVTTEGELADPAPAHQDLQSPLD